MNKEGERMKYFLFKPDSLKNSEILFECNPYSLLIGASLGLSLSQNIIVPTKPL